MPRLFAICLGICLLPAALCVQVVALPSARDAVSECEKQKPQAQKSLQLVGSPNIPQKQQREVLLTFGGERSEAMRRNSNAADEVVFCDELQPVCLQEVGNVDRSVDEIVVRSGGSLVGRRSGENVVTTRVARELLKRLDVVMQTCGLLVVMAFLPIDFRKAVRKLIWVLHLRKAAKNLLFLVVRNLRNGEFHREVAESEEF